MVGWYHAFSTWLHVDDATSLKKLALASNNNVSVCPLIKPSLTSKPEYDRPGLDDVIGDELISSDMPSRQYRIPKIPQNKGGSLLGEPPIYHGADDIHQYMHGAGVNGIVMNRWNILNAPCDGFGWTPEECEAGMRILRKEQKNKRLYKIKQLENVAGPSNTKDNFATKNITFVSSPKDSINNAMDPRLSLSIAADKAAESDGARLEAHEAAAHPSHDSPAIAGGGGYPHRGQSAKSMIPAVPLTINHFFPGEQEDGVSGSFDRNGVQSVDTSSVGGGGGGGVEDGVLSVGSFVDSRWQSGCMYEPARIIAVNPDGSFDLEYESGKTEARVLATSMKIPGVVGKGVCQVESCIEVHGGGCGSGKWPKAIPKHKEVLANKLGKEGVACKSNLDCQVGYLCDPAKQCVNTGNLLDKYPAMKKVVAPFGGGTTAEENAPPPSPNPAAAAKALEKAAIKAGGKPGAPGAPPCIPMPGIWPPRCTPTSQLPPAMYGLSPPGASGGGGGGGGDGGGGGGDPFPHGSMATPAEENAIAAVMKDMAGAGMGGAVMKAVKLAMKGAAKRDAAQPKINKKDGEWQKDAYGGGCVMKPNGGGPVDPECVSEHIKPAPGHLAPFPDPGKKQQTGKEACKGLIHDLCSIASLVCCWFQTPNWLDEKDHQGECRSQGSCDWSAPPPGAPDPGSGPKGKPGPPPGAMPGPPPDSEDPEGGGDDDGLDKAKGDKNSITKPGQGESPADMAKGLDKLAGLLSMIKPGGAGGLGGGPGGLPGGLPGKGLGGPRTSPGKKDKKDKNNIEALAGGTKDGAGGAGGLEGALGALAGGIGAGALGAGALGAGSLGSEALSGSSSTDNIGDSDSIVGGPCRSDIDCNSPEIICSSLKVCEKNQFYNAQNHGGSGEGGHCSSLVKCRPPFECSIKGICSAGADIGSSCAEICRTGLVCGIGGTCGAPSQLGGACNTPDQCLEPLSCSPSGSCIATGGMGAPCSPTVHCAPGLTCSSELHVCKSNAGSACRVSSDCTAGTTCSSGLSDITKFDEERRNTLKKQQGSTTTALPDDSGSGGSSGAGGRGGGGRGGGGSGDGGGSGGSGGGGSGGGGSGGGSGSTHGFNTNAIKKIKNDPFVIDNDKKVQGGDKITGETYYTSLIDLFSAGIVGTAVPTSKSVFDVGPSKCDPGCQEKRNLKLCSDMKPFCTWLKTPEDRLGLCQTHPIETVARFNIPPEFCSLYIRLSRPSRGGSIGGRANVLIVPSHDGNSGGSCRFDPRSQIQSVARSCKYVADQYLHVCGPTCDMNRELMHDMESGSTIGIFQKLKDIDAKEGRASEGIATSASDQNKDGGGGEDGNQSNQTGAKGFQSANDKFNHIVSGLEAEQIDQDYVPVCIWKDTDRWNNKDTVEEDQCCSCTGLEESEPLETTTLSFLQVHMSPDIAGAIASDALEPHRKDVIASAQPTPPIPPSSLVVQEDPDHLLGQWGDPTKLLKNTSRPILNNDRPVKSKKKPVAALMDSLDPVLKPKTNTKCCPCAASNNSLGKRGDQNKKDTPASGGGGGGGGGDGGGDNDGKDSIANADQSIKGESGDSRSSAGVGTDGANDSSGPAIDQNSDNARQNNNGTSHNKPPMSANPWGSKSRERSVKGVNAEILLWTKKYGSLCKEGGHISVECLRNKHADEVPKEDETSIESVPMIEQEAKVLNSTSTTIDELENPVKAAKGIQRKKLIESFQENTTHAKDALPRIEYKGEENAA